MNILSGMVFILDMVCPIPLIVSLAPPLIISFVGWWCDHDFTRVHLYDCLLPVSLISHNLSFALDMAKGTLASLKKRVQDLLQSACLNLSR